MGPSQMMIIYKQHIVKTHQMHIAGSDIQQSFRAVDKFLGLGASKCSPMKLCKLFVIIPHPVPLKSNNVFTLIKGG